jgi:hypothetical protein
MTHSVPFDQTAPYPALPEALARRGVGQLRLRRFGACVQDLQVDLTADRPSAITDLLACCTLPEADRELLWDLPVGKRIECLVVLSGLDGVEQFDADIRCPGCRQRFEVTLTLDELLDAGRAAHRTAVEVRIEGEARRFRLPTGRDQLDWLAHIYPDEAAVVTAMVSALAMDGARAPAEVIEAALDEADPLLRVPVEARCPDCGCPVECEIDIAGMALARMRRSQDALFGAVDLLASRYHWSEAEILSLPAWRRARYVDLLQTEGR